LADGRYRWFSGDVNDVSVGSFSSGAVFTQTPRAITGRHDNGWGLPGARVTSVDTDTAAVMMNALRAIHTVRTATRTDQLNHRV